MPAIPRRKGIFSWLRKGALTVALIAAAASTPKQAQAQGPMAEMLGTIPNAEHVLQNSTGTAYLAVPSTSVGYEMMVAMKLNPDQFFFDTNNNVCLFATMDEFREGARRDDIAIRIDVKSGKIAGFLDHDGNDLLQVLPRVERGGTPVPGSLLRYYADYYVLRIPSADGTQHSIYGKGSNGYMVFLTENDAQQFKFSEEMQKKYAHVPEVLASMTPTKITLRALNALTFYK